MDTSIIPQKQCKTCYRLFPPTRAWFEPRKTATDGLRRQCRECRGGRFLPWLDVLIPEGMRYCRNGDSCCNPEGAILPDSDQYFYWQSNNTLDNYCRACRKALALQNHAEHRTERLQRFRAYRQENQEHLKALNRAYYARNRVRIKAYKVRYQQENQERLRWHKKHYYAENRERILASQKSAYPLHQSKRLAYQRRYREQHPERVAANKRRYYEANKERISDYKRRWNAQNPERRSAGIRNYKARKRGAQGKHSGKDIKLIFRSQKGLCWWCGQPVDPNNYHVDHRIPLSRGGSNAPENLCITCPTCNLSKHDNLPQEWNGRLL